MSRKYNKTFTSLKTVVHDTSILDAQKILVNNSSDSNERIDLIEYINTLKNPKDVELRDIVLGKSVVTVFDTNTMGGTLDNASVNGIQFSSAHFVKNTNLTSVSIPYGYKSDTAPSGYLFAEVCDSNSARLSSAYSKEKFTYTSDLDTATFEFDGLELPSAYSFIRFTLVSDKSSEPNFANGTNCLSFRVRPIKFNNTFTFDDDECLTYNGSSTTNWLVAAYATCESREGGIVQNHEADINAIETSIFNIETETSRIDNSLTEAYNVLNGKISETQDVISNVSVVVADLSSNVNALESKNYAYTDTDNTFEGNITVGESVIKSNVINSPEVNASTAYASDALEIGSESLTPSQLKEIKEVVLGTRQRFVSNVDGGIAGEVNAARISNPYFPTGELTHVRIYHNVNHTQLFRGEPLYLYLNVDGTVYHSSAPVTFDTPASYTDFKFDNVTIPDNYTFVDVLMSTKADIEPSYSNRTNCTSFSSLIIMSDVYGNSKVHINQNGSGGEITTPAIIRVATPGTNEEFDTIVDRVDSLETSINSEIESLDSDIDSLDTRVSSIETAIDGVYTEKTFNTNTMNGALDNASISGIQYSKNHFINDANITSISIPFNPQDGSRNEGYLCIQVLNGSNIITSGYSTNKVSFNVSGSSNAVFNFKNFAIPANYTTVRLSLVANKSVVPDVPNNSGVLLFRGRPIKFNNSFTFDDDDCQTYNGTSTNNWLIAATIKYSRGGETLLEEISNLDNRIVELENKKIPTLTYDKTIVVPSLSERPANDGELNAIHTHQDKVPHDILISSVAIPISRTTTDVPLYLVAYDVDSSGNKKNLGRSINSVVASANTIAKWDFEEPFTILEGNALEVFIAKEDSVISNNNVQYPGLHIACYQLQSGSDTIRYGNDWGYTRDVYLEFYTVEKQPLNEVIDGIKAESDTHITREEADETYLAKEGNNNLAKLDEVNTFTQYSTFNEGLISNGDIILNGSKLLLANDAAIEVYPDNNLPIPVGGYRRLEYYALYKEITPVLLHNAIYHLNEVGSINFALEDELDDLFSCEVVFTSGATPTIVTSDSRIKWVGDDVNAGVFTPVANARYSCTLKYDGLFVRVFVSGISIV